MTHLFKIAAIALFALASGTISAAQFSVSPVRIFVTPRDRAVAITIINEGDEEMVVESELYSWQQKPGGEDELKPTDDLVLSPPMAKLAPKSRQVLRLLRVGPPPVGDEQTYRMIVREVLEARPSKQVALQVSIAFSIPIFVTPPGAKRQLNCVSGRTAPDRVTVNCENTGNAYALVRSFALLGANGEKLAERESAGYLLPQIKRSFELKGAGVIPAGPVRLQATFDDGTSQAFEGNLQ